MKTMTGKNPGTEKVWKAVSGICVFTAMLYFIGFYLWVMDIFEEQTQWLKSFYVNVNPYTFGAYFFGVSVLLFCAFSVSYTHLDVYKRQLLFRRVSGLPKISRMLKER